MKMYKPFLGFFIRFRVKTTRVLLALSLLILPVNYVSAGNPTSSFWDNYSPEKAAAALKALLPYEDAATQIKRGSVVKTFHKLKTVLASNGIEALEGRIIVGYKTGFSDADRLALHKNLGLYNPKANQITAPLGPDMELVDISNAANLDQAIKLYSNSVGVSFVEPDYIASAALTPTDTSYSSQWGMNRISAPQAWDVTQGNRSVAIAVLDCGIYVGSDSTFGPGHPDLNSKVLTSLNFSGAADADDWCDHGSHVAGIAAADTNNGLGVAGAGFKSSLVNIKVLGDDGLGTTSMVINGIYAASSNYASFGSGVTIRVINMSLAAQVSCLASEQTAIDYAFSHNIVVVAAAGNTGSSSPESPASCTNTLAVGNTDSADYPNYSSSYGSSWVDIAAPGTNILSTDYVGGYRYKSGTSMAAPHVAGTAALLWATGRYSAAYEVVGKITSSADRTYGTGFYWASGRLNAYNAVR